MFYVLFSSPPLVAGERSLDRAGNLQRYGTCAKHAVNKQESPRLILGRGGGRPRTTPRRPSHTLAGCICISPGEGRTANGAASDTIQSIC